MLQYTDSVLSVHRNIHVYMPTYICITDQCIGSLHMMLSYLASLFCTFIHVCIQTWHNTCIWTIPVIHKKKLTFKRLRRHSWAPQWTVLQSGIAKMRRRQPTTHRKRAACTCMCGKIHFCVPRAHACAHVSFKGVECPSHNISQGDW